MPTIWIQGEVLLLIVSMDLDCWNYEEDSYVPGERYCHSPFTFLRVGTFSWEELKSAYRKHRKCQESKFYTIILPLARITFSYKFFFSFWHLHCYLEGLSNFAPFLWSLTAILQTIPRHSKCLEIMILRSIIECNYWSSNINTEYNYSGIPVDTLELLARCIVFTFYGITMSIATRII